MHNLVGLDDNKTPFELFHSFALTISEFNLNNFMTLHHMLVKLLFQMNYMD